MDEDEVNKIGDMIYMNIDKKKLKKLLVLTMSAVIFGTCISFNVMAKTVDTNKIQPMGEIQENPWEADDFTYKDGGKTVTGFSEKGKEKVKTNKDLVIPFGVKEIGEEAFINSIIKTLKIPNSVKNIQRQAFAYNYELQEIDFGEGIEYLGQEAFSSCSLKKIIIPNGVKQIGSTCFAYNESLEEVHIGNSVEEIGGGAFQYCKINKLYLGNSVKEIQASAFMGNQLTDVVLPDSLTTLKTSAFQDNKLKNINIPKNIETIEYSTFWHNALEEITIPNTVKRIEYNAFRGNKLHTINITNSTTVDRESFSEQMAEYHPETNPFYEKDFGINGKVPIYEEIPNGLTYKEGVFKFATGVKSVELEVWNRELNYSGIITIYNPEKYEPQRTDLKVLKGNNLTIEDYKKAIKPLPDDVKATIKTSADTSTTGNKEAIITLTFEDDTTRDITIPVKVLEKIQDAGLITPVPTVEAEKEIVPWGKTVNLTDNIKNLPEGAKVEDITYPAIDTKKPGEYTGKAKVTFKDGSSRVVEVPVEVEKDTKSVEKPEIKPEEKPKTEKLPDKEIKVVGGNITTDHLNLDRYLYSESPYKHGRKQIEKVRFDIDDNKYVERKALPVRPDIKTNKSEYPHYIFTIGDMTYIKVTEKGREPRKMDVKPYLKNDRTMLPLRYVGEALNADVKWDNKTRTAYFTRDGITARIQIDGNKIELSNGKVFTMDAKPDNINSRIFVPITNVSQVFTLTNGNTTDNIKQNIEWDQQDYTTTVYPNR